MSSSSSQEVHFARHPGLQHIEARYSRYARLTFARHTHPAYAVAVITHGATRLTLYSSQGEGVIPAGQGDIVLLNPEQAHACNPLPGSDFAYYMLYIDPAFLAEINRQVAGDGLVFNAPLVRSPWLYAELLAQARLIVRRVRQVDAAYLKDLLANLFFLYGDTPTPGSDEPVNHGRLDESRAYLLAHLRDETPLENLAAISGLSPYYFVREFHRQFGLPPITYKLQQRIDLAKQLLREGRPIADVAAEAGFADQSHFTRKFKALVGATPGQYRADVLEAPTLSEQADTAGQARHLFG